MLNTNSIRPVNRSDLAKIGAIAGATDLFPPEMLEPMIEPFFSDENNQDVWLTFEQEGEVLAFAFCEPERMAEGAWNLLAIGVVPGVQGKGIGAMLMGHVEDMLKVRQQRILIVETSGLPAFAKTRSFYDKLGYDEEARIRDYYDAGDDKVIFWKSLS